MLSLVPMTLYKSQAVKTDYCKHRTRLKTNLQRGLKVQTLTAFYACT